MICVSVGRSRPSSLRAEHQDLAKRGAELVELRLDYLKGVPDVGNLLQDRPTPVVVTCRRAEDRGKWRGTEDRRLQMLRQAIVAEADYVDLEKEIAGSVPRFGSTKRIVSHHDFEETPDTLRDIHEELCGLDPDVVKLVTTAHSAEDVLRMMELVGDAEVPTVGFCMGELGLPSRILCGRFGSPFTYATFSSERKLAPGQLVFEEMRDLYRYDSITKQTRLFAVVGDPIGHSMSPKLHNEEFQRANLDAVYLPIRILKDTFEKSIKCYDRLGFEGYSVTIPHKAEAAARATQPDGLVSSVGVANTLLRTADDEWRAVNTDIDAALQSIQHGLKEMGRSENLSGLQILLLGAGGVSRGIAYGLIEQNANVTITNRSAEWARQLASELGCNTVAWDQRAAVMCDVLINGTPVGMSPNVNESPFDGRWCRENMLVFDTIYNPERTLLLKEARERHCGTVSGVEMFVRQAAVQFRHFTDRDPDMESMRTTVRRAISPVRYDD